MAAYSKEDLHKISLEIKEEFEHFKLELMQQRNENIERQGEIEKVFRAAAAKGDLRENAEYSTAEKELIMCNATIQSLEKQIKDIAVGVDDDDYYPIDMVVMYSTVYLKTDDGKDFVFRVYPKGVSDLSRRILSVDSPVGAALWQKKKGESFEIDHRISGQSIKWTVVEIY